MCKIAKSELKSLALCQFRIREVISDKISTLMNTSLLNNPMKFGAKIFRRYQVITFYVLGHFFSRTL